MSYSYRFIADAMLGRLARWLRILGFDTLYYSDISDADLLKIAKQENRLILTRDTHFQRFKGFSNFVLLGSNNTFEQLLEVIRALDINVHPAPTGSPTCKGWGERAVCREAFHPETTTVKLWYWVRSPRCAKCNGILTDVKEKKDVYGLVPEYIYIQFSKFLKCEDCGNIYWEGSHIKRFRDRLIIF